MPGITIYLLLLCMAAIWIPSARAGTARVLIYSATARFRHDSIPTAIDILKEKGLSEIDTIFEATEEASNFTYENLAKYDALVFLSTTGEVLRDDTAFQRYINAGGNFVGIHSASDTLRSSTVYRQELGALFESHLSLQNFTVQINISERTHPSVTMLRPPWLVLDEPYIFDRDPRTLGAKVILIADESTFRDGSTHPIAWYQERGAGVQPGPSRIAGRSFYTALGHEKVWDDSLFLGHVLGGISWVLQSNTTRAFNPNAQVGNSQTSTFSSNRRGPTSTPSGVTGNLSPSKSSRKNPL